MKKFFTLLFFVPMFCMAQSPPHYNTIIVYNDTLKFNEIITKAVQDGFGIQYANEQAGVITTSSKKIKRCEVIFNITKIGKIITITGRWDSGSSFYLFYTSTKLADQIEYRGMANSLAMNSWMTMQKFAESLGGITQFEKR
jgi:hypothetical protein